VDYHAGCPACRLDAERLGPVQGCDPPPAPRWRVERWSMTPREFAGEEPAGDTADWWLACRGER